MSTRIQLTDTNKYERDSHSKAILSNDLPGLQAYKSRKKTMQQIETYGDDINNLKNEMIEIKNLLTQILQKQG
ncbi:hypothetical protein EBV26_04965 [bacterium]|nr:hypothetical protein [bacterium]